MRSPLVPVALAVALLAAACSNSPDVSVAINEPAPPAATVTPEPTATPEPDPTATAEPPTPTSTPPPTGRCQIEALGDEVDSVTSAPADVDGDGAPDSAIAYHRGSDPSTGWRVRVESGVDGAGLDAPVEFGFPDVFGVQSMGGADIDGDGDDEMVAIVGSGASSIVYGVFVSDFDSCTLGPVTLEGRPFEAVAGSSVGSLAGIRCDDSDGDGANDRMVLYDGVLIDFTEVDGDQQAVYEIVERAHTLDGLELVAEPTATTYEIDLFDTEGPIGRFDCPPLLL